MDIYQYITRFYKSVKTEKRIIGKSIFGRNIYAVKLGEGYPVGIAQYAIHGREYITAKLAERQYFRGECEGSVWLLQLVNPDGCLLSERGLASVRERLWKDFLLDLNGKEDFSLWKANGRGVDLNVNFPARWGKGSTNLFEAGSENYIGERPFSEPETVALKRFTEYIRPDYTISYHTKGEEIYWYFHQPIRYCFRDKELALSLSRSTGYKLGYAPNSVGGYKDWCIQKFKIPAFTIEVGADWFPHPLGEVALKDIIKRNENVLYDFSKAYVKGRI
jgi:g-D-glutamyl-meso-diaminopimelate peptidase